MTGQTTPRHAEKMGFLLRAALTLLLVSVGTLMYVFFKALRAYTRNDGASDFLWELGFAAGQVSPIAAALIFVGVWISTPHLFGPGK